MSSGEEKHKGHVDDDAQLAAMGHKAELDRNFSMLSMLGLAFAILNSWTALSASLSLSLPSGGSVSVVWGLITAGICNLCIAASLAEFLSAYPTAGGQYHWVAVSELRSSTAEKAPSFLAADHTSSLPETPEVDMEQLAATFAMKITEFTFSPAEIQGYLLCHINSPLDAITHVESWVEKTLGEKKMKDAKIESQEEDKDTRNDQVKTNKKGKQSKPEKANMDGNNEEKDEGISGTETESDEESSDEEVKQPTGLYQ